MSDSGSVQPEASTEMTHLLEVVRSVVVDVSDGRGLGQLGPDVSFERQLGLGSLERVELAVRAGDAFGVRLSEEAIATVDTPRQLLAQLKQQGGRSEGAAGPEPADAQAAEGAALLPEGPPAPEPVDAATLVDTLEYHVRHQPDRVHIVLHGDDDRARPITYRDLHRAAGAVAHMLRERGLPPGGCVAIMLPTSMSYFASFMGTLMAGGVPVPLYPPVRLDRIGEYIARCAKILDNAQARVLITFDRAARVADMARDRVASIDHVLSLDDETLGQAAGAERGVRASVGPDDTALIQYTSGSTGDPKGVELTQANVMANIRAAREGCELQAGDVVVSWLPLYHDMGLIGGWLMCFYFGVPTVLMSPMAFLSRPERWLLALTEYRATCSVAPNFAFDLCVKRIDQEVLPRLDLGHVRAILNGAEPIVPRTLDRFVERFSPVGLRREAIFCAYGLAENMVAVTFPPVSRAPRIDRIEREAFETEGRAVPAPDDEGALEFVGVGRAVPRHEVRIIDDAGQPRPDRQQGAIQFRGPSSFKGYFRRPDATAEVQREDGWVETGDLGYMDEGELFITGRVKDLIIKGGRNYYPHEIEAAAASVPGIRQGCVAAFAVRDDGSGTELIVVVAETRERDPLARQMLEGRVTEVVTAKVGVPPDRVQLAIPGAIPKTSSGKIRRKESRQLYLDGTINQPRKSFQRQAAGLMIGGLPARIGHALSAAGQAIYGVWAISVLSVACIVAVLIGRFTPVGRTSRRLGAAQARAAMTLAGLRPRVTGLSNLPKGAAILAGNHAGYLDFLICTAGLTDDLCFVIKGELRNNWLVGPALRRMQHVFIDRQSTARSLTDLEEVVALLDAKQRVMLFPEGTFYPEVGMRPFKLGTFRLACETGVPVVPVVIRGSRKALRDGTWLPRHRTIEVEVLEPIRPEGNDIADIVRLRDRCAEAIGERLDEPRLYAAEISVPGGRAPASR